MVLVVHEKLDLGVVAIRLGLISLELLAKWGHLLQLCRRRQQQSIIRA